MVTKYGDVRCVCTVVLGPTVTNKCEGINW